jgi:hypothetical protein
MGGHPANDIQVRAGGDFSDLFVAQSVGCTDNEPTAVPCAYPYEIHVGDVHGAQCNNGTAPPDNGSDGIIIKTGT